ncbi:MAG: hypothetical protein UR68_C0036G0009 [Candidatus Roizmanbacteria bacterium GW2011_GWA2_35_19]|uniref:Uncharacterized protein n=1 Tax=Candidatus Roizmanbacteria bacterium GW2011_GWA2_35_19 TaxID=1618478 RepID=A0A0G0C4Z9_9BACT|nr:MAG: hypothetical protein UR68_C0036G0009 [Candidatus Roizmanbacteria bacterium GW2011_GWA2_35_19]
MVKRAVFLLVIFSLLVGFNFFLIDKVYSVNKKQTEIEKILAEISQNRNESKQFQVSLGQTAPTYETDITVADGRVANLKSFFRKYGSPLYNEAEIIVKVSDQYQFDYRLLPAIAMQESNLCRVIPHDSYNCWGWGIYGTTVTRFESYEQAIKTVAKGISENYINKGLVTASMIMSKYTPSSNGSWAYGVNTFLKALE